MKIIIIINICVILITFFAQMYILITWFKFRRVLKREEAREKALEEWEEWEEYEKRKFDSYQMQPELKHIINCYFENRD